MNFCGGFNKLGTTGLYKKVFHSSGDEWNTFLTRPRSFVVRQAH